MTDLNRREDMELGYCLPCQMAKIKRDGVAVCANCDTVSEPSGIVSTTEDPGMAGYKKVTIKGKDGKSHETYVPAGDDEDSQESPEVVTDLPQLPVRLQKVSETISTTPAGLVDALRDQVKAIQVETMGEFKKRKKVIDQIDKLEFLINQLKGDKK